MQEFTSTAQLINFATCGDGGPHSRQAVGPFTAEVCGRYVVVYKDFYGVWRTKQTAEFNPATDAAPYLYADSVLVAA